MIPPSVRTITRSGQPSVTYDPIHAAMQSELLTLLNARFGKGNVILEKDNVDITITAQMRKTLIEIKSDADARVAIRKALGQILEYAYFGPGPRTDDADLVIIAPGQLTENVSKYVKMLRDKFHIPVTYCPFSLRSGLPALFR